MYIGTLDKNRFKHYELKYGRPFKIKEVKFLHDGKESIMYIGQYNYK